MSKIGWTFVVLIGLISLSVFTFTSANAEILIFGAIFCSAIAIRERVRMVRSK